MPSHLTILYRFLTVILVSFPYFPGPKYADFIEAPLFTLLFNVKFFHFCFVLYIFSLTSALCPYIKAVPQKRDTEKDHWY